ncbi:hypothetical protein BABINDRAFT_112089 [Babjeviella inositovora NRRL Y-12698]|uniref:Uncharacterized protein n=1 Tax=Babjeviella inositovora NRRL Y-12698 TaxID=984486 RepID=A0A1E3QVY2_9ASCO|nr:uncharacterized protein BABINDRAFT_112089 [Babjeviella inositovora NRRL Y-12698]ODQ81820.1 hypothetical protein BABINDRAFT_112089 [Babjeviella inositovora NRRL Y-12698]
MPLRCVTNCHLPEIMDFNELRLFILRTCKPPHLLKLTTESPLINLPVLDCMWCQSY